MFPKQVFLSVDEMAQILGVSKSHIYRMCEQDRQPFVLVKLTSNVQVSIVEMARYLDTKVQKEEPVGPEVPVGQEVPVGPEVSVGPSVPAVVVKKRMGRPLKGRSVVLPQP